MEALRTALFHLGISQDDAAELLGLSGAPAVNNYFGTTRPIKAEGRDAICRIVGMTMEEIEAFYGVKERAALVKEHRILFRKLLLALEADTSDTLIQTLGKLAKAYSPKATRAEESAPEPTAGETKRAGGSRR